MANYMIRFLICNIFICGIIEILVTAKKIFKNILSSRMQYNLWFFLLGLLAIPFVPFRLFDFQQIFLLFKKIGNFAPIIESTSVNAVFLDLPEHINFASDFAISINNKTSSFAGLISFGIWIIGMFTMVTFIIRSYIRLYHLKKSALSLQHKEVRSLYHQCLAECQIKQNIPIYSTAFLKSPIMVGFLNPCIYLPIHAVSEYNAHDMRYMLLHELQHYKHKDALINHIINIAGIVYWFNPFIWHALKEMRYDREVACDTSVLKLLQEEDYKDYGNTLINYAEKVSLTPFPFASGISGNMKQMKKRILNIAAYKKPSIKKRIYGILSFGMIAALLFCLAPMLSTYAAEENYYQWNSSSKNISYVDYSSYFKSYEGCFVLYDSKNDTWNIHNLENATLRVSPDSTYKIYDALFGLEENIITPANSFMKWNHENYPFKEWNMDQTLNSAMQSSVNWYFQSIDKQLGKPSVYSYIQKIGYGNQNINGNFETYWLESSLKISPIEQVELLTKLQNNSFNFSPENINVVKDSISLSSSEHGNFYGKTGTGRVNEQNVNGWFIGYIETADNTYFFATNINASSNATGSKASEITMSILNDMSIWK